MNNNMPEVQCKRGDWASRIQIFGTLFKKPFGHQSNKWARRFFMVKDGFLFYYGDRERKEFDRRQYFNIHPKGIFPLGECTFEAIQEPGHPFCMQINNHEVNGRLVLAAESDYERSQWMDIMEKSRRVTWKNMTLADEMIRQMESQGLQMAREKQDYFDRLQSEVFALSEEKMKTEELERLNQELEKEKLKMEQFTQELKEEYEKIKEELEDTTDIMAELHEDRIRLADTLNDQQNALESLASDRKAIMQELKATEKTTSVLSKEKQALADKLHEIESKTQSLLEAKSEAENRLKENEERTVQLEEEKINFAETASELKTTIQDLAAQKEMTEQELKEEVKARLAAEMRLRAAEGSLLRLENVVEDEKNKFDVHVKEEMVVNVKKLKEFFENLAEESRQASEKPIIMRNAVYARKTLARRAKTMKYINRKRSSNLSLSGNVSRGLNVGDQLDSMLLNTCMF
ncbi:pleckstrin homology domain-containing family D member 1-like isoform X3 [Gigantopelta aegis]|uniref:pleckstrin homology domain-containing family D member 1-like isoform X3 n=1 Tax=Gigantopelta aegis TaxID=1735272 RepID=UPI001B887ACF|nr:pleckstrin homology domain-containing family D member 1-like isoform X3 [Gigantopelta aegis]XP_041352968.1 pleckstrin homology domain-containing family D member 1-like isoform X3 [Gigantopelta aegis]XP_041352969.1 pleckstrin homology domain-containing family D member 1-like isoform X3 [Gigantopelta aegis]XP_041352970.1 pleckstrin homology domain-containing family D member 1-like isoform X3 [Gigantopelta aegis]